DGVSAVHQRRDPRRPGPRPAESRGSEDAAGRQLRAAPGLEAADAATKGLPLLVLQLYYNSSDSQFVHKTPARGNIYPPDMAPECQAPRVVAAQLEKILSS